MINVKNVIMWVGPENNIKKKNVDERMILKMNKNSTYEKIYLNAFEITM